jgi:YD repeat-containing protein
MFYPYRGNLSSILLPEVSRYVVLDNLPQASNPSQYSDAGTPVWAKWDEQGRISGRAWLKNRMRRSSLKMRKE